MQETVDQYIARVLSLVDGKDPLAIQKTTPQILRELIQGASPAKLAWRAIPEKWSAAEILAHLAEAELVVGFRMRFVLGANGSPIPAFDQDVWARNSHYERQDPHNSMAVFISLRQFNLILLESLPAEMWQYYGVHQERGKESIERMVRLIAGHDLNHLHQIQSLLSTRQ